MIPWSCKQMTYTLCHDAPQFISEFFFQPNVPHSVQQSMHLFVVPMERHMTVNAW